MSGLLAGLLSKLAGLGTAAKAAVAAITAAVTMTVAGGATGVLPLPGGHVDSTASVQGAVPGPTSGAVAVSASSAPSIVGTGVQASTGASTTPATAHAPAGVAPPAAKTAAGANATATATPQIPSITTPTLPTLPAMPACIKDLIPAKGTTPDPATLIPKIVSCVQSLLAAHLPASNIQGAIGSANLPANVSTCLSSVFASLPGMTTGSASGFSQVLAACMPTGSLPSFGSIPLPGTVSGTGSAASHKSGR